jgi:hypothetical protein
MGETTLVPTSRHHRRRSHSPGELARCLLLEGTGGCDPDACEVKRPCKAIVVAVVVQYVEAGVLCRGRDQCVCEGNSMLPSSIGSQISQRSNCGSLR